MLERKSWEEFKDNGFLWWVNSFLHLMGWCIVLDIDDSGKIVDIYPARTKFRGFSGEINSEGYIKISKWMKENSEILLEESKDE